MGLRHLPIALICLWSAALAGAAVQRQNNATYLYPGWPPLALTNDQGTPPQPAVGILVYPKNGKLCSLSTAGSENCTGGVGGSGYATIQNNAVALPQETTVNFVNSGCVDNAGALRTDCTFGTVTSVGSGTGLTGGPITGSGSLALSTPVAIANGGTNAATALAAFNNLSPLTTTGDLLLFSGGNNTRLAIGGNGTVLSSNGTTASWQTPASGGTVTSISQGTGITATPNPITGTGTIALTVPVVTANGGTGLTSENDNTILFGQGANPLIAGSVPSCSAANNGLTYTTGSHALTCNTGLMTNFTVAGTAGTNPVISNGNTLTLNTTNSVTFTGNAGAKTVTATLNSGLCTAKGSALNYNNGTDTITCQGNVGGYVRADSFAGVDCTGATNSRTGLQTALNTVGGTGQTLFLPSGCLLGLDSPGTGLNNAAITLPNNVHILCADQSAGFFALRQYCSGGTYPNAHCLTNADCLGGGTCVSSFGASANPPTATQQFANTAGTHWMFRDAGVLSSDVNIENCSFYTYQADPYQICTGGTNNGRACRQECDNASGAPPGPGGRCETNADCNGGTCLRTADCHAGGGTCGGVPGIPVGTNPIDVLDLSNTSNASIEGISVFDHFNGDFAISTGPHSTFRKDNFAREFTDGTSPIPSSPTSSGCFTTRAGDCNYGAFNGTTSNVQPTTSVTNDVTVGNDSQLLRVSARGSTTSMTGTSRTRIDESTVEPHNANGPGTPAAGYAVTNLGIVAKSYAQWLANNVTGIALNGGDSTAIEDKLQFATGATTGNGILIGSSANTSHVTGNVIRGLGGSMIGINIANGAGFADVKTNYIDSAATTGTGVDVNGQFSTITGNQINSNPVDTLSEGITVETGAGANMGTTIDSNQIVRVHDHSFRLKGVADSGIDLQANKSYLSTAFMTTAFHPVHVLADGVFFQNNIIDGNFFTGGWRGIDPGGNTLMNIQMSGNRFLSLNGAAVICNGAGCNFQNNYVNANGGRATTCDPTCRGGSPVSAGQVCNLDTDCTGAGNTCNGSVQPCVPEPVSAWIGDPKQSNGTVHSTIQNNLLTSGNKLPIKQCTVAGPIGQMCDVASCNGGATCSGTPATCQSGADSGKLCCQTAAGATCAVRSPSAYIRYTDPGSATTFGDNGISGNQMISGQANTTMIDFVSSASLGNMTITFMSILDNHFSLFNDPTSIGIALPTAGVANITDLNIGNNSFDKAVAPTGTRIANYQGQMGTIALQNGTLTNTDFNLTTSAQTVFSGIGKNNTSTLSANASGAAPIGATAWKMTCTVSAAPSNTSTRTFSLLRNLVTTFTCTISGAQTSCTTAAGSGSAPVVFAGGEQVTVQQVSVVNTALVAANATCGIYWSNDGQ